jgi:hypothetical protein
MVRVNAFRRGRIATLFPHTAQDPLWERLLRAQVRYGSTHADPEQREIVKK